MNTLNNSDNSAFGAPGVKPFWSSGAKTGVGTALSDQSRVWFTLSHGICNEIYYPEIDQPSIRDMGLIVTSDGTFFSEEENDTKQTVKWLADGVPGFHLVNTCDEGRYRIEKQILSDPKRDTVLQKIRFTPEKGKLSDYQLYALLAPHLDDLGEENNAWIGEFDGAQLLFAQRNDCAVAMACSSPFTKRSVGYVGASDGWQDMNEHKEMTWEFAKAENGNVALTGEIDLSKSKGNFTIALGFGANPDEAAKNALASLHDGFDKVKQDFINGWQKWMKTHSLPKSKESTSGDLVKKSLTVLRTHESKKKPGAFIASLGIPWGFSNGDSDSGGYHVIWARDLVEIAGGMLAGGAHEDARRVLFFLQKMQEEDGHWLQNMWLDGSAYWNGIQMDETALPILLVNLAYHEKALNKDDIAGFWPMVKKAAGYLVRNGASTPQDRWEEDSGYTPFTVAAEIAALLAAADFADLNNEDSTATYLREAADVWFASIDRWLYVDDGDWCQKYNVEGYYVRIDSQKRVDGKQAGENNVHINNVPDSKDERPASRLVSPDALAFVRFGLLAADDSRISNTVKVIDALLKVEAPTGDAWHRYNDDGYGEHEDGSPFDGTGIGRCWPVLTGERAHYELAAGHTKTARKLLSTMEAFAGEGDLIPEQIWDSPDIPEHELSFGHPSGSAMPLAWSHSEYLKLNRSLLDGHIFDQPQQTVQRYIKKKTVSPRLTWSFNHKLRSLPPGKMLRIETLAPAIIHWSDDDWKTSHDQKTHDSGLGVHLADISTESLSEGSQIEFTFHWPEADKWEGQNFAVQIAHWKKKESGSGED